MLKLHKRFKVDKYLANRFDSSNPLGCYCYCAGGYWNVQETSTLYRINGL